MPTSNPVTALGNAQNVVGGAARNLSLQRQQLPPYPLSDNVFVDQQFGIMTSSAAGNSSLSANLITTVPGVLGTVTNTVTVTQSAVPPAGLVSLVIQPRNFLVSNPLSTGSVTQNYYCVGYFNDSTTRDLTAQATWSVVNNVTQQPNPTTTNTNAVGVYFSGT